MMQKIFTTCLFIFFLSFSGICQETEVKQNSKWDVGLEGMAGFSVGENIYAFNVGGPSLLLRLNQDFKIGVGGFPSFYFLEGKAGARLGVGPRVDYKNFAFFAPFFHRDTLDEWVWTVGLGYKFHRK